jgi:hypothetical protein
MPVTMSKLCAGVAALVLLVATGCAYTTRNSLPRHVKTIAVPVFANKTYTDEYTRKLEVELTNATRNAFIQAGELKLAGRENADLILEGEVVRMDRDAVRVDRFGDPAEVQVLLRARISVYDVKEARYLMKDQLVVNNTKRNESGVYNLRRGENENMGRATAIDDLGKAIARTVTERW